MDFARLLTVHRSGDDLVSGPKLVAFKMCNCVAQDCVLTLNIPRGVLRGPLLVCYWLTSVEINKHNIFDTNNA